MINYNGDRWDKIIYEETKSQILVGLYDIWFYLGTYT